MGGGKEYILYFIMCKNTFWQYQLRHHIIFKSIAYITKKSHSFSRNSNLKKLKGHFFKVENQLYILVFSIPKNTYMFLWKKKYFSLA